MSDFKVQIRKINKASVIDLQGYLDAHTAAVLENHLMELINLGDVQIVVNFRDLQYISSAGLGVFMAYIEDVRDKNGDIKLCAMSPKVYNVFDLLGFPVLYDITESEQEALDKFNV